MALGLARGGDGGLGLVLGAEGGLLVPWWAPAGAAGGAAPSSTTRTCASDAFSRDACRWSAGSRGFVRAHCEIYDRLAPATPPGA